MTESRALMAGKKGLVMGVANERSLAWGIARSLAEHGAELALTYQGEALEKRVRPLADQVGSKLVLPCDVTDEAGLDAVFDTLKKEWGKIDFLIHAIAYSDKNELSGMYVDTSRDNFMMTMDISVYSFTAVARRAAALMDSAEFKEELAAVRALPLVDHEKSWTLKKRLLELLFSDVKARGGDLEFSAWRAQMGEPLERHATFDALSEHFLTERRFWPGEWPEDFKNPRSDVVAWFREELQDNLHAIYTSDPESIKLLETGEISVAAWGILPNVYRHLGPDSKYQFIMPAPRFLADIPVSIVKGRSDAQRAAAIKFVDFMLSPESQTTMASIAGTIPANPKAEAPEKLKSIIPPMPIQDVYHMDWSAVNANYSKWEERWMREVQVRR